MTIFRRMSLIAAFLAIAPTLALACEDDSDCASDKECKESVSGNKRCYPKEEKKDKEKKGDYKKIVLRCDKTCPEVWDMCGFPLPAPCKKSPRCCYLPED